MRNLLFVFLALMNLSVSGQKELYPIEFNLKDVSLLEGPLKSAQDLNIKVLLEYDVDRLLAPYLKEAGLTPKGADFVNWDGLAGHIGGHYLTAMAINYASTGNMECKARMDYMLAELKACQDASGDGYIGGIPNGRAMWAALKVGDFSLHNTAWVPWYNIHKIYAGLRDAWLYGESEEAKTMFIQLCDWGINTISGLSDAQIQTMLNTEFGGMNEVYADAYQMTGDEKYMLAAKTFTHNIIYDAMSSKNDNLDNKHANTQIPKIIGFARIAQLDPGALGYAAAADFFWETVVTKRSLAMGGNSRGEHFPTAANCTEYTTHREGPESCNTYNMMKLTEDLFSMQSDVKYVDYYERALYNHILSTQHPKHGGYVYFTPVRPRHYRVYSHANQAMWCCVGSGMENHGKYGQFIYTHKEDDLYVNLFVASKLNWDEKGLVVTQETGFPYQEKTHLSISLREAKQFKLMIRNPGWVSENAFKLVINGDTLKQSSQPGTYLSVDRVWNDGDAIEVLLPMHNSCEELPNVSSYIAFLHGPILLGARTGTEGITGLVAGEDRWGHIANGRLLSLAEAPFVVSDRDSIASKLEPVEGEPLTFTANALFAGQPAYKSLVFEPFFQIHDARYMMYWMALTKEEYAPILALLEAEEKEKLELDRRTVDAIATGEQQPDVDHKVSGVNTNTGTHQDEFWRDATEGGYFAYEMSTNGQTELSLWVRYWGYEWGDRDFDILVDDVIIGSESLYRKWNVNDFRSVEYAIDSSLLVGKDVITVRFQAKPSNTAGGVFYLRLLTKVDEVMQLKVADSDVGVELTYNADTLHLKAMFNKEPTTIKLFSVQGALEYSGEFKNGEATIFTTGLSPGIHLLLYKIDGNCVCQKILLH